jgi:hypothetical protein
MWPEAMAMAMGGGARLLAALLTVAGLAACAAPDRPGPTPVTAPTATTPDGVRDRTVPWEAGRRDPDPRRLVISWTGADPAADPSDPCWVGYAPEVSAEPDRVVVWVRSYHSRVPLGPQQACADMGFVRTLSVALHDELGGRAVVDGHSGRRQRLAPVPLEPRWLPPGWRLVQELGQPSGGGPTWERTYGPGPDAGGGAGGAGVAEVTVADGPAVVGRPSLGMPGDRVVARPAVRGGRATVERSDADQTMAVRWREGRRGLAVRASFPTTPSERAAAAVQALLVRIARGLG